MSDRQTMIDDLTAAGAIQPNRVPYGVEIDPAKLKPEWIKPGDFISYRQSFSGNVFQHRSFHTIDQDAEELLQTMRLKMANGVTLYPAPAHHPDLSPPDLSPTAATV